MKKTSKKVVFFGSGPVAAKSLELLAKDFEIEAVITKPSTVKQMRAAVANGKNTCVYSVNNKSDLDNLMTAQLFESKLGILIDFGIIVSQQVIDYFPLGIINSHFSLLPQLRGADPITFSILNGDTRTGVSLMLLVEAMDEGPLLAQAPYDLPGDITTPQLTEELIRISYATLREIVPMYLAGNVHPTAQPSTGATYSRKFAKEDGVIDWNKPAVQLEREIRAFAEWPKSRTILGGKEVIITKAHVVPVNHGQPGHIEAVKPQGLLMVDTADGYLCIERLKPAGKREMSVKEFLAGYKL